MVLPVTPAFRKGRKNNNSRSILIYTVSWRLAWAAEILPQSVSQFVLTCSLQGPERKKHYHC